MARIVRGAGALALVAAGLVLMTSPAWAEERTAEERVAYTKRTCERILRHRDAGDVEKTTVPDPGSQVRPGDLIKVRLTWEVAKWDISRLHKVIDCVTVDGVLDMELTMEEKPSPNDGVFEGAFTVPEGLEPGTEICDQGFLSGDSPGGEFGQDTSDVVCFTVDGAAPDREEAAPTTSTTIQPAAPTTTTAPPPVQGEQERRETPAPPALPVVQAGSPAPPAAPAPAPREEPRPQLATTGVLAARALLSTSGLAMTLGGLGLMGGARRPSGGRRRR